MRVTTRRVCAGGVALAIALAVAPNGLGQRVLAQSWDASRAAIDACEQQLESRMGREAGGRAPSAGMDQRSLDVQQPNRNSLTVRGKGTYRRDQFDRGRPYTFRCTYDTRNDQTTATYTWGGGFPGTDDDQGYTRPPSYRPPPGSGSGTWRKRVSSGAGVAVVDRWQRRVLPGSGRVFFSGGIINRASGKGLDVENEGRNDGANIQQWDFGGKPNQTWDVIDLGRGEFSIVNQASGKALDVANRSGGDGANVQQYRWHNGDNQRWRLQRGGGGFYQIISVSSGRCLDVNSAQANENGGNVQQWSCSGQPNQLWRLGR